MKITLLQYILNGHLIPILAMIILMVFVCLNPLFARRQSRLFIIAISAIVVAIVVVSIDTYLSYSGNSFESAYVFRRITSFLNFSLSPVIPFILFLIFSNEKKLNILYAVPMLLNVIICFFSIFFQIVFFITPENTYDRGVLFLLPFIASIFYVVMVIIKKPNVKNSLKMVERLYLFMSILLLAISMIMEIVFYFRFVVWSVTALIFVLYYLLLNINARLVDPLTGIYNRAMYEKTIEWVNHKQECVIAMLDINGFKNINDTYGHVAGDKFLINFAMMLNKYTRGIASVYRIGGDEFFCVCKKAGLNKFNDAIKALAVECAAQNYSFAWGSINYNPEADISQALENVDQLMYQDKQEEKQENNNKKQVSDIL